MAKLTKRLLIIAMAVVLVAGLGIAGFVMASEPEAVPVCFKQGDVSPDGVITAADAIYLLYASFPMFKDEYPLNQDCDFEDDGVIDRMDAIYLLYASNDLTAEDYPLKEMVHNYHAPVWSWDEAAQTASVTLKCGCGQEVTLGTANGVSVSATVDQAATCTAAGTTTLSAEVTYEGVKYEGTKAVTVPATGIHALNATPDCVTDAQCANCDYEWIAPGHNMKLVRTIDATCQAAGEERYECQNAGCGHYELVTLEQLPHTLHYVEGADHVVAGETCVYVKKYACDNCTYAADGTAASDTYTKHDYSIVDIVEATCVKEGTKTYKCACGAVKDGVETIPVNENHNWGNDGKCQNTGCNAAKVVATDNKVTANALTADTSLELTDKAGNAVAMTMDQAALDTVTGGENANRELKINIDEVSVGDLNLEDTEKESQIRGTVYDFSMVYTDTDDKVTDFGGKVTVTVPYTLSADETADDIDVWYVDDNGEIESVKGTYCNGYVTFTVEHFSYYTVTRLTPAERCERYGHMPVHTVKEATCTEAGYDMTACQRCGEVTEKTITQPEGHKYGEAAEVAATCTQTGTKTLSCLNCSYKVTSIIPAKGHDMKQDADKSVAATCTKEGKLVKVCAAEGCDHTTEEAVAQLAHDHVFSKTQAATCTAGGYDLYICQREGCGNETKKNETAPLGHSYPTGKEVWEWTEDEFGGWTAKVKLTCANGCGAAQTLDAVVVHNADASQNASCLGSGATVYNGTVCYNNVIYTNTKEITQVAPGHQPGTAWEFNDGRHYRICKVCQEMVDPVAHTFGEAKVIKKATCTEAGEQSVACTVCGYSKTSVVPATGIHDMVNGECADCGFKENECTHLRMHASTVDVSQYAVCPGLELTFYTCDCGENQYIEYNDHGCSFPDEWEYTNDKDEYGFSISTHTATCTECGLKMVDKSYSVVDKELCTRAYVNSQEVVLNGQVLGTTEYYMHEVVHPGATLVQTVELTKESHGLCGETIEIKRCPCGAYTSAAPVYREEGTEGGCQWQWTFDEATGEYLDVCNTCGAKRTETYKLVEDSEPCLPMEECIYTYYVNGKEVYACSYFGGYYYHDFQLEEPEMLGDKCTDGMVVKGVCTKCGEEYEDFVDEHMPINEEVIDLSGTGICADRLIQAYCPCDEHYAEWYLDGDGSNYCQWSWSYDYELEKEVATCMVCGTRRVEERTYGDKGEDCLCTYEAVTTFTDKDGNEFATGLRRDMTTHHNEKFIYTLAEGAQSCEDGVIRKEYCTDCDYEDTYELNYHESYELASYDLSAFESCTKRAVLIGCACGQNAWLNLEGQCNWQHVTGSEFSYTEKCTECGLTKKESWTDAQTDDPCEVRTVRLIEFSKEGVDSLKLSYDRIEQNHNEVYELALKEGSKTCSDGFTVTMTCTRCDYRQEYSGYAPEGEHPCYTISRELLSEGELCGTVYECTVSCACGEESWTRTEWEGDHCQYQGGTYSEEEKAWVYPCVICGGTRTDKTTETLVEGTTCTYAYHEVDTYRDKDGNVLFTQEYNSENDRHTEICTFRMNGTTCQEGYYVDVTCQKCGYTEQGEHMHTDCSTWTIERKTLFSHEDACSDQEMVIRSCPCGKNSHSGNEYACNFNWKGWDSTLGGEVAECVECGLTRVQTGSSQRRPGTCLADVTNKYTFIMGEEEPVYVEYSYVTRSHVYVTTFTCNGTTCEDGWTQIDTCHYCGDIQRYVDTYYRHETYTVAYYDLTEIGACGGYVEYNSCACGKNTNIHDNDDCSWTYTDKKDELGLRESYCSKCGIYRYEGEIGDMIPDTCTYKGTSYYKLVKDGEAKVDISCSVEDERHSWEHVSASLETPGTTCEQGLIVHMVCEDCGKTTTGTTHGHNTYTTRTIDLAQLGSSCGGYIYQQSCPCGMRSTYEWDMNCDTDYDYKSTGDYQNGTDTEIRTCRKCGLVFTEQRSWTTDPTTCMKTITGSATVEVAGVQDNLAIGDTYINHKYENTSITLAEGAKSCEDGILVTQTCANCQHSYTGEENYHRTYVAQRQSLSDYGSVCGGELQKIACACGEHARYMLAQDNTCKPEQKGTELWIEDAIDNQYQYGTLGYRWFQSEAYTFTCPVTDPACSLKLRMAEYWLVEGCTATEYQTWQYYDAATSAWVEIDTVTTGEKAAFHAYTQTDLAEKLSDGSVVSGYRYDCACGSYAIDKTIEFAEGTKKTEYTAVNTVAGADRKAYSSVATYDLIHKGYRYVTERLEEYTNWDNAYWSKYEYTYDFENGCIRTEKRTDSDGYTDTYQQSAHNTEYSSEVLWDSTCTQFGGWEWKYTCQVCGLVTDSGVEENQPTSHNWGWYEDQQTFICNTCGLESTNGASGDIVLEDLTEEHGTEDTYVIGYWNRTGRDFVLNMSVVSATGEVLKDLTFQDYTYLNAEGNGVNAVSFSISAAKALAAAEGYTGGYGLRITFVPTTSDSDQDCAITFDVQ